MPWKNILVTNKNFKMDIRSNNAKIHLKVQQLHHPEIHLTSKLNLVINIFRYNEDEAIAKALLAS